MSLSLSNGYSGWTAAHILPRVSEISVSAVEAEIQHYMESQCLNSLLIPERTISSIVSFISHNSYSSGGPTTIDAASKKNSSSVTSPMKSPAVVTVATIVGDGDIAFHRVVDNICDLVRSEKESAPNSTVTVPGGSEIRSKVDTVMVDQGSMTDQFLEQRSSIFFSSSFEGDGDNRDGVSTVLQPTFSSQSSPALMDLTFGVGGSKSSSLSSSKQNIQKAQLLDKDISLIGLETENIMLKEEITQLRATLVQIQQQQQQSIASTAMRGAHPTLEPLRTKAASMRDLCPISEDMSAVETKLSSEIDVLKADLLSMVAKNKSLKSKITQVKEEVDSLDRDKRVLQFENTLMKQEMTKLKEQLAYQSELMSNSADRK